MEGILLALAVFLLSMDQQVLTRSLQRPLIACTIFGLILGMPVPVWPSARRWARR